MNKRAVAKKFFLEKSRQCSDWLIKRYDSMFGVRLLEDAFEDIQMWFDGPLGSRLLQHESQKIDKILPEIFGYHLMQLSVLKGKVFYQESPVTHCFNVVPSSIFLEPDSQDKNKVVATFESLPIESDSIDVALLHHTLEYSSNPHQLLREVARTTIANGHVIIIGFNRWSILNVINYLACFFRSSAAYKYRRVGTNRLKDWCKVLELEPVYMDYGYHMLPLKQHYCSRTDNVLSKIVPFLGQYYVLVVRKNVNAMSNIQFNWKKKRVLPQWGKGVVSSSTSHSHRIDSKKDKVDISG